MQKPISRQELYEALVELGLFPLARGRSLKVLVADDDPKAVELTAVRVLGMASTVLKAYGGQQAIDIARRELPDLLVLDLMMPDVSGFDVVTKLQEQPETARIPSSSSPPRHSPRKTQEAQRLRAPHRRKERARSRALLHRDRRAMSGRQQGA